MAAITWRNIDAPSIADASRAMYFAGANINGGFDTLKESLKQYQTGQEAQWKKGDTAATQDVLGKIYQAQTAGDFNTLSQSGALDQTVAANGAQIDRAAVNALRDGRMATMQQRELQGLKFGEDKLGYEQAGATAEGMAIAQRQDPVAFAAWQAANPANRKMADVLGLNRTVSQSIQDQQIQNDTNLRGKNTDARAEALQPGLLLKQKSDLENDVVSRALHTAQAQNFADDAAAKSKTKAEEAKRVELSAALKDNLYREGSLTPSSVADLAVLAKNNDIGGKGSDAADKRAHLMARITKAANEGVERTVMGQDGKPITVRVPVPLSVAKAALLSSTNTVLSWNGGYADDFEDQLKKLLPAVTSQGNDPKSPFLRAMGLKTEGSPVAVDPLVRDYTDFDSISRLGFNTGTPAKKR